ncbi:MAG: hypothetical protein MMC33_004202 [Icmadophila ericetorum]|nr:hypothetical protein [Icmadophila ericetorum]
MQRSLTLLYLIILIAESAQDFTSPTHINDPEGAAQVQFDPVWPLGSSQVVSWEWDSPIDNITIFQENPTINDGSIGPVIHGMGKPNGSFVWTVNVYSAFNLTYSRLFYLWANYGATVSFTSRYFNIADLAPAQEVTTTLSLSTAFTSSGYSAIRSSVASTKLVIPSPATVLISVTVTASPTLATHISAILSLPSSSGLASSLTHATPSSKSSSESSSKTNIGIGLGVGFGTSQFIVLGYRIQYKLRETRAVVNTSSHPDTQSLGVSSRWNRPLVRRVGTPAELPSSEIASELPGSSSHEVMELGA